MWASREIGDVMRVVSRHSGIEVIDADECLRLLAAEEIGRVAVVVGPRP